jgi:cobalt/nickel transport system permease protein
MKLGFDSIPAPPSAIGRLDPRWKLAALTTAAVAAAVLRTLPAAATAFAGALLLAVASRLPWRWYLTRLGAVLPFLALFVVLLPFLVPDKEPVHLGPVMISPRGLALALLLCLKALTILTLMLILLATAPLNATLQAAHALHVPGLLVQLALLTYRYVFLLAGELGRLRVALRVRGYRNRPTLHSYRTIGHVAGTLLVRSAEHAERVGQAMRCRGFDGRFRSVTAFRTTKADLLFCLLVAGGATAIVVFDFRP